MLIGDKTKFAIQIEKVKENELYSYFLWINNHPVGHKDDSADIANLQAFLDALLWQNKYDQLKGVDPVEVLKYCESFKKFSNDFVDLYDLFIKQIIDVDDLIDRDLVYAFDDFFIVFYSVGREVFIVSRLMAEYASSFDYSNYTSEIVWCKISHTYIAEISNELLDLVV